MKKMTVDNLNEEPIEIMILLDNQNFLRMSVLEYLSYYEVKKTARLVLLDLSNKKSILKRITKLLMHSEINNKYEISKIIDDFYFHCSFMDENSYIYLGANLSIDYMKSRKFIYLEKEKVTQLLKWAHKHKIFEITDIFDKVSSKDYQKTFLNILTLDIRNKNIYDLPDAIMYFENLTYINLCDNQIRIFPTVIFELEKLESLDISYNDIKNIPIEITQLEQLEYIHFEWNRLQKMEQIGRL